MQTYSEVKKELYQHQKDIIEQDPKKVGIWLGTGGGKTLLALELARGDVLIIVPKQQKLDETWENNIKKFDIKHLNQVKVISKEEFRRDWEKLSKYTTVIIDEAHNHFGVTTDTRQKDKVTIPKTSQLFDATLNYLKKTNPERFYMCSATPVSKPMNIFAIAKLFGNDWNYYKFRETFYIERKIGWRTVWLPNNSQEKKEKLVSLVKQMGYTGTLSDWFDVPEQTHTTVYLGLSEEQEIEIKKIKDSKADPMILRTKMRCIENGCLYETGFKTISERTDKIVKITSTFKNEKIDYILERAQEFPKMLIFANYTAQVFHIAEVLKKEGYNVLTLTGSTKDRGNVVSEAENSNSCIVIAQSGISSGYELKSIPCVIFASKSNKFIDYDQGLGRVLRADHLKKNLYIHLVIKSRIIKDKNGKSTKEGADESCHESILRGEDFQEQIHENN